MATIVTQEEGSLPICHVLCESFFQEIDLLVHLGPCWIMQINYVLDRNSQLRQTCHHLLTIFHDGRNLIETCKSSSISEIAVLVGRDNKGVHSRVVEYFL